MDQEKTPAYVVVIGGVNIDIGGKSDKPLVSGDSNPGAVTTSLGGVGRNIAHNLSLLGVKVVFLTSFGDDDYARRIEASCGMLGIDISHALSLPDERTSIYLYISDPHGDMHLAVSDMAICDRISPGYIAENLELINGASAAVIDANLPEKTIRYIAENVRCPLFADPVSTAKAGRLKEFLGKLYAIKPNRIEAELLSGISVRDEESLKACASKLLKEGVNKVYISLGDEGVLAADEERMIHIPSRNADVKNATGAGDAFMAGVVFGYLKGLGLEEGARLAVEAASIAIEGEETINPALARLGMQ
ncbi:MAG: carbohydrate kinase family protein [Firmicutes bacterium]|nr:carbohydrate kinase family protein [Bacillota bacterium]